jgi:hypothetical protein
MYVFLSVSIASAGRTKNIKLILKPFIILYRVNTNYFY